MISRPIPIFFAVKFWTRMLFFILCLTCLFILHISSKKYHFEHIDSLKTRIVQTNCFWIAHLYELFISDLQKFFIQCLWLSKYKQIQVSIKRIRFQNHAAAKKKTPKNWPAGQNFAAKIWPANKISLQKWHNISYENKQVGCYFK